MAEGGEVSGRREELIRNCSPCSTKGRDRSAVNYCFMCEASFCQDCTEQHSVFLNKHRVTEIESVEVDDSLTFQTGPCPQHGKALTFYCKKDDTIACETCITREHISCKEVVYLPTTVQDVLKDIDVSGVKVKLRETIEHFESIKINQQATVTSLEADRERCMQEIDDHHADLQYILDKIVKSSKDKIDQTFDLFSADLQHQFQEVEKCLVGLELSEKCLGRYQGNDLSLFVELKNCQNQLNASENISRDYQENLKVRGFSVAVDDRLHNLLSELESFVTMLKRAPAKMKKKYNIDVSDKGENTLCSIYGSCVLYDGSILLVDLNNKMLKCIDQHSLKVKDKCRMQNVPIDVCVINKSEVAVAQRNNRVAIVSVNPRLATVRTISMNHHCGYITCSQGELFITDVSNALFIYNMEGILLRKVSTDLSGQNIFSRPTNIIVNAAGDKVYIADRDKCLIILDRNGQVKDKLVIDKILNYGGMCLDGIGGFFVCGFSSNNIVHMSADGQVLTEVLTSSDELVNPLSVCYDRLHKKLVVTQFNSNHVHMSELE